MNPRVVFTSQPRINARASLIRLLKKIMPGPWTLVALISFLLFWLLSTAVLAQHRQAPKPKSFTIEQVHQIIPESEDGMNRSLHGLIEAWYRQARQAGKSKPQAAGIALKKLEKLLDEMYSQLMDTTAQKRN